MGLVVNGKEFIYGVVLDYWKNDMSVMRWMIVIENDDMYGVTTLQGILKISMLH